MAGHQLHGALVPVNWRRGKSWNIFCFWNEIFWIQTSQFCSNLGISVAEFECWFFGTKCRFISENLSWKLLLRARNGREFAYGSSDLNPLREARLKVEERVFIFVRRGRAGLYVQTEMRIFWLGAVNYEISPFSLSELPCLHETFFLEKKYFDILYEWFYIKTEISWLGKSHSVSSRMLKSVHSWRPRLGGEKFLKEIQADMKFNFVPSSDGRCNQNINLIARDQSCSPDGKMLL